jgi:hypothetical protein
VGLPPGGADWCPTLANLFNGRRVRVARPTAPADGTRLLAAWRGRRVDRPPAANGVRGRRAAVGDSGRPFSPVGLVTGPLLIESASGICRKA